MDLLMLLIFFAVSTVHLYARLANKTKLRAWTKVFILPALLGWYVYASSVPSISVILALLCSWLGDVLLIPKGKKWFLAGGICFLFSHIFFIHAYLPGLSFGALQPWVLIVPPLIYIALVFFVFRNLRPHLSNNLFYTMVLYQLLNGAMNCFAFYRMISMRTPASLLVFIGAALFFTSDGILFHVRFNKDAKDKTHFGVMLSYILGEFLIVLGLLLG